MKLSKAAKGIILAVSAAFAVSNVYIHHGRSNLNLFRQTAYELSNQESSTELR